MGHPSGVLRSSYALSDPRMMHDIEVLVLRLLPRYLRALTRQEGHFLEGKRIEAPDLKTVDFITRKPNGRDFDRD